MRMIAGVSLLLFSLCAVAADASLKPLIAQAKASSDGKVMVHHVGLGEVMGELTDITGDVFCVKVQTDIPDKSVEYCFPYASVDAVIKPGTGAHSRFTGIWINGSR